MARDAAMPTASTIFTEGVCKCREAGVPAYGRVRVKKLLIVEQILERMKALGLNRSKLAAKMEVSPARITPMMDGLPAP